MSDAVQAMSEGELFQIEKARKLDITEEIYFDIIRQKTAALIAACCASGAQSVCKNKKLYRKCMFLVKRLELPFKLKTIYLTINKNR